MRINLNIDCDEKWKDIPTEKENAVSYNDLCIMWDCNQRVARAILHELSVYESGDDFVLIRSSRCKGFYKTDDPEDIEAYRNEILKKGKSIFVQLKKCNKILKKDENQLAF